ncbi:hypothetical protein GCM10023210_17890 [Chryseobacterium ginsengisoli]|uniref:DUF6705 domain-containing protein n=1 Tax=Chryseobacterium ginsengisoli TaxID=363853 RepID=A0ABP9M976_9FLAO
MKYLLLILITSFISCKAQTVSLEEAAQCHINPNCPHFTYAKDVNNSLQKYLGTWKGNLNGKVYEIKFIKKEFQGNYIKDDLLVGRIKILDSNNQILYNTIDEIDDTKTKFRGLNYSDDLQSYMMQFSGPAVTSCINRGTIYLNMNITDLTKMSFIYLLDYDITNGECPSTFVSTIPQKQRIYLTKQ